MAEFKKIYFLSSIIVLLNIELIASEKDTLLAIDIDTAQAQFIKTTTPLTVTQSVRQTSQIINTGKTLTSTTFQQKLATLSGGPLNQTFLFCGDEFFWDLTLQPNAGVKIDGVGSHVQALLTFSSAGCQNPNAFIQILIFIYVEENTPAPSFGPFSSIVNRVTKAGTSTVGSEYYVCKWFFSNFANQKYYMYKQNNGPSVIVIPKLPMRISHKMSNSQFYGTFGKLKNAAGQSFSHRAPLTQAPPLIMACQGVKIVTTF